MPSPFDPTGAAQAVADRQTEKWLAAQRIETVHIGLFDSSGVLRQKTLRPPAATRALEHGWSFIDAIQWWRPDDTLAPGAPAGAGTQPAHVDPTTARPYPFGPTPAALFLAEFTEPLCQLSPRYQVQNMIDRAAALGLEARVGWEFECIVLEEDGTAAMTDNRCWSAATMATEANVLADLMTSLEAGAVPVDHICAELGPGCLELATAAEPAMRSADSAALAKLYTKAFFAGRNQQATFMAQLDHTFPGLGGHPSLSLHSTLDGTPVLTDAPGVLSKVAGGAIAGITELLPQLLVLAAPLPNSFRRFGPGNWAPSSATWGMGNYSCALRVVADDPATARLELRIPGADISPHQCLALMLGAAVWGIERNLEPPPPVPTPEDGRHSPDAPTLPRDLTEAAERLQASAPAHDLFGPTFTEHMAALARAEAAACHRLVSDAERARYQAYV